MPTSAVIRPRRRLAASILLGALAGALSLLVVAAPAQAHDELVSSDPSADATVDAVPAALTLTFSGELADDEGASEVAVTDASGASLTEGPPSVDDTVLTQPLSGEASGVVTVLWKVVSSDGHPISGEFTFTVAGAPTPTPTATPTPTPSASAVPSPEPTETSTPVTPPAESSSTAVWPWVVGGILLVALAAAVTYLIVSRSRRDRELADGRGPGAGGAANGRTEPPLDR